jgi:GDP-L-fucose synthase
MNGTLLQKYLVKACQAIRNQFNKDYVSLMPTNLWYDDNFDLTSSHVLPAMMRKFHEAKENGNAPVTLWEAERQ